RAGRAVADRIQRRDRAPACALPDPRERAVQLVGDGPLEADGGVAPGRAVADVVPLVADAQAADDADARVREHELAVVAAQHAQRVPQRGRREAAYVAAGAAQLVPVRVAGADAAEPVIEDEDLDAGAGTLGERAGEAAAHVVVTDDVVLEDDAALRARDDVQHRGERRGPVDEHGRGVAERERRLDGPPQRALEQRAETGPQAG